MGIIEKTAQVLSGRKREKSETLIALKRECQERIEEVEKRLTAIDKKDRPGALEQGTRDELIELDREREQLAAEVQQLRTRSRSLHSAIKSAQGAEAVANAKQHRQAMEQAASRVEAARSELDAAVEAAKSLSGQHQQRISLARQAGVDPSPLYLDDFVAERVGRAIHGPSNERQVRGDVLKEARALAKGAA